MKRFLSAALAVTVLMSSFSDLTFVLAQTIASEQTEGSVLENDLVEVDVTPELKEEIENEGQPESDSTVSEPESNKPESETPESEPDVTPNPEEGLKPDVTPTPEEGLEPDVTPEPEEGVEPDVTPEPEEGVEPDVTPNPEEGPETEVNPEPTPEPEVDPEVQPDDELVEDVLPEDEEVPVLTSKPASGTLEFDLHFPMPLASTDGFNLVLTPEGGSDWVIDLVSGSGSNTDSSYEIEFFNSKREPKASGDIYFVKVKITDLALGEYSAKLNGSGYQDMSIPSIELNQYSKRIKLASTRSELATPQEYPTAFLVGELNGDGVVTQDDYDFLLEQLDSNDLSYDLNRDGKLDITDLTYVYGNIGSEVQAVAVEQTNPILLADHIQIDAPDVTVSAGQQLSDLLVDESLSVLLSKGDNQAPSVDSPLKIEMDFATLNPTADSLLVQQLVIKVPTSSNDADAGGIESGFVTIEDESGNLIDLPFNSSMLRTVSDSIVIDLGSQVAVKKISINVTGNRGNKVISEIAKVEFINNVYKELPKPDMNIPTIKTVETSTNLHDERITISWDSQPNVTSYEVTYEQLDEKSGAVKKTKKLQTNETSLNILDKDITPYSLYRVKIQSLNGDWSSGYVTQEELPLAFDGKPDNVDENYNPITDYYNGNIGSVTEIQVIPNTAPGKPLNLVTTPGFKSFSVTWEKHIQARDFDIYYRKVGSGNKKWVKANQNRLEVDETSVEVTKPSPEFLVRAGSYVVNGLEDNAVYEVRVSATNHLGTSQMSDTYLASTENVIPPVMSSYNLINRPTDAFEVGTSHIVDVVNKNDENGWGQDSRLTYDNKFALVDGNFGTSWRVDDWDTGAVYGSNRGSIITFDDTYTIGSVAFAQTMEKGYSGSTNNVKVTYWTEDMTQHVVFASQLTSKVSNTHRYYVAQLPEPIEAKKIKVDTSGFGYQTMSELKFYEYSSLEDEVSALFADDLRVKLSEVATLEVIEALIERVNTPDEVSGDEHPNKATLLKELELAKALLLDANLSENIVSLDATLRDNGGAIGISNAWQSLGAVARPSTDVAGESKSIVVYMGSSDANTQVEVTFLQAYGQPGQYIKGSTVIKPGRTEIVIPEIFTADVEKGGAVMAKVRSGRTDATIQIRLSNIDEIPHLNVNQLDDAEMKVAIGTYLTELEAYVAKLPTLYPDRVSETDKLNNVYAYDEQTSVLNSTDIEGNRFTLTVPATQILRSIQSGLSTKEAQIERIYQALMAWEQEMLVTYAKKGVFESVQDFNGNGEIDESDNAYYQKHKAPSTRLNVKYQRMVMGAAAYASSHHVGVGYGEVLNFMRGIPYVFDESNQVMNGDTAKLYGALMGHEIGHVVDIKNRIYAETSNNLLASITDTMLNQDNPKTAGIMTDLYKKVTSHTSGLSTNRSVVLGMLWQPHLAYENESTSNMLITNFDGDLTNDSYFAKLNRAYREMSSEELADGDRDQWLIRLSSKVVGKDLSDFYVAHGITPNQTTLTYVSQFEKELRPIQYLNDEARRMRLAGTSAMALDTVLMAAFGVNEQGAQISDRMYLNQKTVPLELSVSKDLDRVLGFEIYRNGVSSGFVLRDKSQAITLYEDQVHNTNNRVFKYEAVAYDYELNATERVVIGEVKVRHDGALASDYFTVSSNTFDVVAENNDIHGDLPNMGLVAVNDGDLTSVYEGRKLTSAEFNSAIHDSSMNPKNDPFIVLDLNSIKSVIGLKYTAPTQSGFFRKKMASSAIKQFKIEVSQDGSNWTTVNTGSFKLDPKQPTEMIYFGQAGVLAGSQLNTYDVQFVKLTAVKASVIGVGELELVGPPGDNIEIGVSTDDVNYENGLGLLAQDFVYQRDDLDTPDVFEEQKIPKGSVVITGEYRGNPAFNVPLVLNEDEVHIADEYHGILLAQLPSEGQLEEITEGTWIYWVEPEFVDQFMQNKLIFAELYRTDSADLSTGGQRLTSDTFTHEVPEVLPSISFSKMKLKSNVVVTEVLTK